MFDSDYLLSIQLVAKMCIDVRISVLLLNFLLSELPTGKPLIVPVSNLNFVVARYDKFIVRDSEIMPFQGKDWCTDKVDTLTHVRVCAFRLRIALLRLSAGYGSLHDLLDETLH